MIQGMRTRSLDQVKLFIQILLLTAYEDLQLPLFKEIHCFQ
jgi:hypothetical protein